MNRYRKEIDGLRAIAVLAVIFFHFDFSIFQGGYLGVDIFFVISGYLITSIIIQQTDSNNFKLIKFYERRARRIIPILFVVILVSYLLHFSYMLPGKLVEFTNSILATLFFLSNFYFWSVIDYFNQTASNSPLLHTWSLAVEEQFYLFFPIFIILITHFKKKYILYLIIILCVLSFLLSLFLFEHYPRANFYFTFTRAWEIFVGCICAYLHIKNKTNFNIFFCYAGAILIFTSLIFLKEKTAFPPYLNLLPVIGTCFIILFSYQENLFIKVLSSRIFVKIGLISYSLYLWHQVFFSFLFLYFKKENYFYGSFLCLFLTFMLSFYSWKYIEKPFRSDNIIKLKTFLNFILSMFFIIISICILTLYYNGFPERYNAENQNLVNQSLSANAKYTESSFKKYLNQPFMDNTKKNILIIGDSFGQDLSNILDTTPITNKFEISTLIFSHHCKKLFKHDSVSMVNKLCPHKQKNYKIYDALISEADIVFLAINWNLDQYKRSDKVLSELKKVMIGKTIILGIKDFGNVKIENLLKIPSEKRKDALFETSKKFIIINSYLSESLKNSYIDQFRLICKKNYQCPKFNNDGELLSYDGKHLTKEGVEFFREKIDFLNIINREIL